MTLNTVTVTWTEQDIGQAPLGGNITFTLNEPVSDSASGIDYRPVPKTYFFTSATGTSGALLANDSASLQPAGSHYTITVAITGQQPYTFTSQILFANGASQTLAYLQANAAVPAASVVSVMPLPTGTPAAGQVPVVQATGSTATAWGAGGSPWVTLPSNWYSGPWFAAKAAGFVSPAWILFDGDSVTNGVNPGNNGYLATGWPDQLRTSLLASTGASVYGDFYPFWAYTTGSGALDPVDEGFAALLTGASTFEGGFGSCLSQGSSNAWFQIVSTGSIPGWTGGNVTGFDLVYYDWGVCTWGFTIDGGQGGSPTVSGATWTGSMWQVTNSGGAATGGNVKKVTVRGLTAGTHQIEHGQVSSAGNVMMIGLSLFTGHTGGVGFARSAYSGRRAVDSATAAGTNASYSGTLTAFPSDRPSLWSGSGPTNATAQITPTPFGFPTQPTLATIAYGINDCATYVSPGAFGDAIERKIIAIRRGVANANIGVIAMSYPDIHNSDNNLPGNGGRYVRWKRVMAEVAAAYNCAFIDIDSKWGGTPVGQGFQVSGNVHPATAGSADIASTIAAVI